MLPVSTPRRPGGGRYTLRRRELELHIAEWEDQLNERLTPIERRALEWQRFPEAALAQSPAEYDALLEALTQLYERREGPLGPASLSIDGFPVQLDPPSKWLVQNRARARQRLQNAWDAYQRAEAMIKGVVPPQLPTRQLSPQQLELGAITRSME